jgi:hypothetical protein
MSPAAGPFLVAAFLLVAGGLLKFGRPTDTVNAMTKVGVPATPALVRAGSAFEIVLGGAAFVEGGRLPAALLAASYLAFAVFVLAALLKGTPIASCGCFGRAETPATPLHVVVNVGAAGCGLAVALDPGAGIADVVSSQPYLGIPFVLLLVVATLATFLVLSTLPQLLALVRTARG